MQSPSPSPHLTRPTDPYLRWMVTAHDAREVASVGSSVAWWHAVPWTPKGWVTARGEDQASLVAAVTRLVDDHEVGGYTVPQEAASTVQEAVGGDEPRDWCWWHRGTTPERVDAVDVLERDDPRINVLLEHSDSAYMLAGDERVTRWLGIEESGALLAVAGVVIEDSGAWHLVSVCTDPDHRGRGLAREVCRAMIGDAHRLGAPAVVLEMFSDNAPGRRVYTALGFTEEARFRSCVLEPGLSLPS